MKWLEDQVASIRDAATHALQKVAQEFGGEWAKENLVPRVGLVLKNKCPDLQCNMHCSTLELTN